MACGIYALTDPDGRRYIGSSNSISTRWEVHKRTLRIGKHHCASLQAAWNAGIQFRYTVLEHCSADVLLNREIWYVKQSVKPYNTYAVTRRRRKRVGMTMTLSERIRDMLVANPEITAAEAIATLPDANPNTVRTALARARNVEAETVPRSPEHDALIRIVGMYADGLVSAEHMFEMMKMVVSK